MDYVIQPMFVTYRELETAKKFNIKFIEKFEKLFLFLIYHYIILTCKCLTGSATTVLLHATLALRRGRVVGNGRGLSNCC